MNKANLAIISRERALEILLNEQDPVPALAQLYRDWYVGDLGTWQWATINLLADIDPIVRTLCNDFGFRFDRKTLADFLDPAALFKIAFCSSDEMPDFYASQAVERLRARFSILPRIRDAGDIEQVLSDDVLFLHPMHYVTMSAQSWLRSEDCKINFHKGCLLNTHILYVCPVMSLPIP